MSEFVQNLDWNEVITTVWTVILVPLLTYVAAQVNEWAKSKKIDKYTDILQNNMIIAVKDVYQTIVSNIKGTDEWTDEKKMEVKEIAKTKAINALSNAAYECLKQANDDFEQYLDSLVESSLFDIKNAK